MNFKELIESKFEEYHKNVGFLDYYKEGAEVAKDAIIELLEKINDGNFDNITGEPLSSECEAEILTIRNLIKLIKESKDYE